MLLRHLLRRPLQVARGERIGRALAGAWREPAPALAATADLDEIVRPVTESGGAGLLLRRLRAGGAEAAAPALGQAYRQQVLDGALRVRQIEEVLAAYRAEGIDPLLVKGFAIARLYPGPGLRPYSDIDLAVEETQVAAARAIAARFDPLLVDLHAGLPRLDGRDPAEVRRRIRRIPVGATDARVLGDEDHLHLLCMHLLAHGARRVIWLCDIAVAVEQPGLDWDWLRAGDPRDADAVASAIALAGAALGARLDGTPHRGRTPPGWMTAALYAAWGAGFHPHGKLGRLPLGPLALLAEARRRWPNPIQATASARGPYDDSARLPLQVLDYLKRTAQYLRS